NCDTNVTIEMFSTNRGTCPIIINRVWVATDDCSNSVTAGQPIIVQDPIPPVLLGVPTNRTFQCLADVPAIATVTATDNCDTNVTITRVSTTTGTCPLIIVHCWPAT